ncbi:MAG TPA: hypothetical protein VHE34_17720 [Puia sp.]|uniref:hypothetical protein n=1 Tax=Puia sp. TaxID=2045100 RepID=UPI002B59F6A8|nr:hypothetical protein [Puia sp.]HVU97075.1 hypothetical protein [Puia sp.]
MKGNTNQVCQLNLYLDTLSAKVLQMECDMVMDGVAVNFSNFREKWLGLTEPARMLLDVFQQHNDQMAALFRTGKDFCPATLDRYYTSQTCSCKHAAETVEYTSPWPCRILYFRHTGNTCCPFYREKSQTSGVNSLLIAKK